VKDQLIALLQDALQNLAQKKGWTLAPTIITVEHSKAKEHGDFACNIAMVHAKSVGLKPREFAEQLLATLPPTTWLEKTEIAGPGFINFFIHSDAQMQIVAHALRQAAQFGHADQRADDKITVEFVSANPTGPLHVGHGRGAAYGSSLANVLQAAGYAVQREYYVNDAGRQMDILAASVWLRYLQTLGEAVSVPAGMYVGDYVEKDCVVPLQQKWGERLRRAAADVMSGLPQRPLDNDEGLDDSAKAANKALKDPYADAVVARCKALLGDDYPALFDLGLHAILADIRDDLAGFGVRYDSWFSEKSLTTDGYVARAIATLKQRGHIVEADGALVFKATDFGDDKDRVVVRSNGAPTYFASDLGYLLSKFERGFKRCIYVFGADHHGYVTRLRAAAKGLGLDDSKIDIPLVQFAVLYRGDEQVKMSTRSGQFVTLRELREEVGADACRYFYCMRSNDQHLDFDLDLAKKQSKDNPVFYVQYAHARICRMFSKLSEKGLSAFDPRLGIARLDLLQADHERTLAALLARFPETIANAAAGLAPHMLCNYVRDLATALHSYYEQDHLHILGEDTDLRNARLALCGAVRQALANGLAIIGVSAPEAM
jgi:arginyl-tRNA synthetase